MKKQDIIICVRTINLEYEVAKDNRQDAIDQKWGDFLIKPGIALKGSVYGRRYYNQGWDDRFNELGGKKPKRHINVSTLVTAEQNRIKYIISTDYDFIKRSKGKSNNAEVIRPVDFLKIIE